MNRSLAIVKNLLLITVVLLTFSCSKKEGKAKILVFSKTAGYHHESIAEGNVAIEKLGSLNNFDVDTTTDAAMFTEDTLKKYAAVVFLSTTGDVLNYLQEAAFERYIQAGGGYMGIHAAADCEYDWGWYGRLVGGYFLSHPGINDTFPNIQPGILNVVDKENIATKFLPAEWKRTDEFYSFKKLSKDTKILLKIDEKSYHGGANGDNHPMAWYHAYDGGRAFYTALGHTKESFSEDNYLKHILGGIQYAIGDNKALDYSKAKTQLPPEDNRFTKTQLSQGDLYEPTEMTVLPNLDILVIQRRGEIMLYKQDTKKVKQVGFLNVYFKTSVPGVNAEEGMLGLSKDPDFAKNSWVYIYYSPIDSSVNRLSRFSFKNDTLDKATEKVILEVKSQREICCHTGGSIAFGPDKLLYFSAGDNSTPFDEPGAKYVNSGYSPTNDFSPNQQYDARRSSGNTNDLRGKIMRIRVKEDGSYEIPDGNLFPKGMAKTRPEIYVMGNRNPYRISVDQKNSNLYWGEVGPDANNDSLTTRGPRGYDEINQARKAGYFGWPLFVGNNYAYRQFDYGTGKSGDAFDPAHPINNSKYNTGLKELPPAQPAFIWYPYAASPDFPQLGTGGRNAMVGPVYYTDLYPKETRLPEYYNGKLLIYDWIRGWVKAVTMLPNGDFDKMEPFFPSLKVNSLIDMEVGPDGKLYLLEYGNGWFTKNIDAGIARIDFNGGNRPPVIASIKTNKSTGVLPFAVKITVDAKDLEKDKISYKWNLGNGTTKETTEPTLDYTYATAGDYIISVQAKDDKGASSKSDDIRVYAGNETPTVTVDITGGNKSFYLPGVPVQYAVTVADKTDTAKFDASNLYVSVDYVEGFDKAASPMGHQQGQAAISGKTLMLSLDCKSCHKEEEKSVGPSFIEVSKKYGKDPNALAYLSQKIIKGGSGVWGQVAMAAHPTLSQEDVHQIVGWVLSLSNKAAIKKSLPQTGSVVPPANQKPSSVLVLSASYTDKGGNNIKALTGNSSASLKNNMVLFSGKEKTNGFTTYKYNGMNVMVFPATEGWFALDNIDLTGVKSLLINSSWKAAPTKALAFEARLDEPDGKVLGSGSIPVAGKTQKGGVAKLPITTVADGKMHTIYILYKSQEKLQAGITSVQFSAN
ncbi:ThuA domain-containing protein [Ferruginibacter sp.]|uniref:ThuA domain-containing protein n=1 Tax=Ferruginibacter sp. TaxID=1940288 RepID=UPI0019C41466|nr:ThuA domain-containing protein [Ferruginibacter sp.]MBC7629601.1 ThuA domain-containing protein [Ferruginibacter sp.]